MLQQSKAFERVFLLVMDSVGIGELPDAGQYGDEGAHTLGNIARYWNGLSLPQFEQLGLGNIVQVPGIHPVREPIAAFGKMREASAGKDTMTGHWELMGLHVSTPFCTFTETGFPTDLITELEKQWRRAIIGNKAASGTEIIAELGAEHMQTGAAIVYTSADSVLQIAAHEDVIPVNVLYEMCAVARQMTVDEPYKLGRIIARPFRGEPGHFQRTANRKDFALHPHEPTVMNHLLDAGYSSIAIGKISDIFAGEGVSTCIKTRNNAEGIERFIDSMGETFTGLSVVNLVDFDAVYGHRRDPIGYGNALKELDDHIPQLLQNLRPTDLLIITADHGNDPTHHGTDHTREYVPLFAYSPLLKRGHALGERATFADVGMTIAENFRVQRPTFGTSFLGELGKHMK